MSAKIALVGHPEDLHIHNGVATFTIVTSPASSTALIGLPLFEAVTYRVQYGEWQYNRGRAHLGDHSDLVVEGCLEPRVDERGKSYIAVVAMSVASILARNEKKLQQLRDQFAQAEEAYDAACASYGDDSPQAQAAQAQWTALKDGLLKFLDKHPEFQRRSLV